MSSNLSAFALLRQPRQDFLLIETPVFPEAISGQFFERAFA
jgi:hypothetical protein